MMKRLIIIAVVGAEENNNNKILVYVKGREKRKWLADILDSDDSTIKLWMLITKIDSLHNLDVTNAMWSVL